MASEKLRWHYKLRMQADRPSEGCKRCFADSKSDYLHEISWRLGRPPHVAPMLAPSN